MSETPATRSPSAASDVYSRRLVADEPDLSLATVLTDLVRGWYWIVGTVAAFLFLASAYMWLVSPEYTATLKVFPNTEMQNQLEFAAGGLSASLNPFSTDAVDEATGLERYLEALTTVEVSRRLAAESDLLKTVFKSQWREKEGDWRAPQGPVPKVKRMLNGLYGLPGWQPPDARDLSDYIGRRVSIASFDVPGSIKTIGYRLTYTSDDPAFARSFLDRLHNESNRLVLEKDRRRERQREAYLKGRLKQTANRAVVETLSDLLIETERKLMLMSIEDDFAAVPLEETQVSKRPTSPKPLILLVVAGFLGTVMGAGLALLVAALRRPRPGAAGA